MSQQEQAQQEPQEGNAPSGGGGVQGLPAFDMSQNTEAVQSADPAAGSAPEQGQPADSSGAQMEGPLEQFYETKLFRVLVSRKALVNGHVVIEPKAGHAHLYNFDLDEMEEFGYLMKKVSFWAMRLVGAQGFTVLMHDGTPEVDLSHPLRIHVLPRIPGDPHFQHIQEAMNQEIQELEEGTVLQMVGELQNLMQLPQEQ